MKIYRLSWYLANDDRRIVLLIAHEEIAMTKFNDLRSIQKDAFSNIQDLCLQELVEDEEGILQDGEVLHLCEY